MKKITKYLTARKAAIEKVNKEFYGQDFSEKLKKLWETLPKNPTETTILANDWLGQEHPDAMLIAHEAMLLTRKPLKA